MKPAAVWMMICGIVALAVGALLGLAGLSEWSDYTKLTAAGNPFAGLKGDIGLGLIGAGIVGVVAGLGLVIGSTGIPRMDKQTYIGTVRKADGAVWNGTMYVTAESWAAVHGPTV